MEKIGIQDIFDFNYQKYLVAAFGSPNRRLLNKKVIWEWRQPYNFVAEHREKIARRNIMMNEVTTSSSSHSPQSERWSNLLNEVRTYFEQALL